MLEKIRKLLKSGETVSDIRSALAELDVDKLRGDYSAATSKRSALLLTGTDEQVLSAEKDAETARLAIERAEAAKGVLEGKLASAEAREFDEAFERQWKEADAEAAAVLDFVKAKVVPAVKVIEDALVRLEHSDKLRMAVHRQVLDNVMLDNAAGRSSTPDGAFSRIDKAELIPGWLAHMFGMRSRSLL
jgi:type II secretory pathway component HofQ